MGCFTLPGEAGVQQLEGNVHRDERNSGTYYHTPLLHHRNKLHLKIYYNKNMYINL